MSNFYQRAITGAVFVAVLIGAIYFHFYSFLFLFATILVLSLLEFYKIVRSTNVSPQSVTGVITGLILFITVAIAQATGEYYLYVINIPVIFLIFIIELFKKHKQPFLNISYTILGVIYIALPISLLNLLVVAPGVNYYPSIVLGFFFLLWSYDTGAYIGGRLLGRNKLFERISPKKTWEGAIAGLVISIGISYLISQYFTLLLFEQWAVMAVIIAVTGTLGDLTESMLKRSADIKDSGSLLPGHGGVLDRFDALFISVPFVVAYLYLFVSNNLPGNFF
ncbi:MAG: phosphatidate cytidylyltransferase [Bacteroidia bacterium]